MTSRRQDMQKLRAWLNIALFGLAFSIILSFFLVLGRTPGIHSAISPFFAKRCLVIHVNLAMHIWLYAFLAALFYYIFPSHVNVADKVKAPVLAVIGIILLGASAMLPGAVPVLSNYVPVVDHPLFFSGLAIFTIAILLVFLDKKLITGFQKQEDSFVPVAVPLIKAAVISFLVAIFILFLSWLTTSGSLYSLSFYEVLFWGCGHILQFANMAGMAAAWMIMLSHLNVPLPKLKWNIILFRIYLIPVIVSPLLLIEGTRSSLYHYGFTRLMEFGIFPVFVVLLMLSWKSLRVTSDVEQQKKKVILAGFIISASMMIFGFILGAMVNTSNTSVPAHYHASIMAVTVAYMTVAYLFAQEIFPAVQNKWKSWPFRQLIVYGFGQTIFIVGFEYAGLGRKIYGVEQQIDSLTQKLGMIFMGVGGFIAIGAGFLFICVMRMAYSTEK